MRWFYACYFETRLTPDGSSVKPFFGYGSGARVQIELRVIFTPEGSESPTYDQMDAGVAQDGALILDSGFELEEREHVHVFDLEPEQLGMISEMGPTQCAHVWYKIRQVDGHWESN